MSITISDDIVQTTNMSQEEIQKEFAIFLYKSRKYSLAKCATLLGMGRIQFQKLLASKDIPINYEIEDVEHDFSVASKMAW